MHAKYQRVASVIERRIRDGGLADGERLPGEAELAKELQVSRGTVRQALGELQRRQLIDTHVGVGSFVTFDGVMLDTPLGWADAFSLGGIALEVEVLDISPVEAPVVAGLAPGIELQEGVSVRRVRRLPNGPAVSHELAVIPATGDLAGLPERGLVDGSLTATLARAGLRAAKGTQEVALEPLSAEAALVMGRMSGEPFLQSRRTSFSRSGAFVEHVVSDLDPAHFRLRIDFGTQA